MARLNDTPGTSGLSYKRKGPERTERIERTEQNRQSSILIDGDGDDEQNRHEVTLEDFLKYIQEKPEWLYGKLRLMHERFDVLEDREARLAEAELEDYMVSC